MLISISAKPGVQGWPARRENCVFVLMVRNQAASFACLVPPLAQMGEERTLRGGWQPSSTMVRAAKGKEGVVPGNRQVEPSNQFNKPSRRFWCILTSENHCSRVFDRINFHIVLSHFIVGGYFLFLVWNYHRLCCFENSWTWVLGHICSYFSEVVYT